MAVGTRTVSSVLAAGGACPGGHLNPTPCTGPAKNTPKHTFSQPARPRKGPEVGCCGGLAVRQDLCSLLTTMDMSRNPPPHGRRVVPCLWLRMETLQAAGALLHTRKVEIADSPSNIGAELSLKACPEETHPPPRAVCAHPQSLGTTSREHSAKSMRANPTEAATASGNEAAFPSRVRIEPCPTTCDAWITQLQHFFIPSKAAIHSSSSLPIGSQ